TLVLAGSDLFGFAQIGSHGRSPGTCASVPCPDEAHAIIDCRAGPPQQGIEKRRTRSLTCLSRICFTAGFATGPMTEARLKVLGTACAASIFADLATVILPCLLGNGRFLGANRIFDPCATGKGQGTRSVAGRGRTVAGAKKDRGGPGKAEGRDR